MTVGAAGAGLYKVGEVTVMKYVKTIRKHSTEYRKRFFSIITDGESIEGLKFETGDKFNGEIINDTNNTISLQMY